MLSTLRADQLDTLTDLYGSVGNEGGGIALIRGAAASGKTALVAALGQHVRAGGGHVVMATGSLAERQLPFGVIDQFLATPALPRGPLADVLPPRTGPGAGTPPDGTDGGPGNACGAALHDALSELSARGGSVVCVDDAHLADPQSLSCLTFLARRLRDLPVLLVLALADDAVHRMSGLVAEMERFPYYQGVALEPLSRGEITRALGALLERPLQQDAAAEAHALSGGNALVLAGLVADVARAARRPFQEGGQGAVDRDAITPGPATRDAVLSVARRADPVGLDVLRALAVVGPAAAGLLPDLIRTGADRAARVVRSLRLAGLLARDGFRHPFVREVIVESTSPEQERELHLRAAEALHTTTVDARHVARHLLAAGQCPPLWGEYVLYRAAEDHLAGGGTATALRCLALAVQGGALDKPADFLRIATRMEWWKNETDAENCLDLLVTLLRGHRFPAAFSLRTARHLLAHGRTRDVEDLMARLVERSAGGTEEAVELRRFVRWLRLSYPPLAAGLPAAATVAAGENAPGGGARGNGPDDPARSPHAALWEEETDDQLLTFTAELLRDSHVSEAGLESVEEALTSLVYRERLDLAAPWCASLLEEAAEAGNHQWHAIFAGFYAEIAGRRGDLRAALTHSAQALADVPAGMWGLRIGLPLGSRAQGLVAAGDLAEAGRVLKRGYPRGMLQTRYGLHYLRARGHYHLAMGRHELALRDFLACGELTMRWEMDSAAFLPWRLDLAETLLCSGETARAREIAETQMDMAKGLSTPVYAASLRLWAATAPEEQRRDPLERSVRLLENSVNRLEYARSLAALGRHHHETGEPQQAGHMLRKARALAGETGAEPLAAAVDTYARETGLPISAARPPRPEAGQEELKLSDAERRVAVLVLEGCTNRQISERLYITQSTVSQHLTRIYRKMKVNHRGDLVHELREALPQNATGAR